MSVTGDISNGFTVLLQIVNWKTAELIKIV